MHRRRLLRGTEELKRDFRDLANDLDTLFLQIMARYGTTLYERESLIVFDEVQCFPFARGMIEYLVADGRCDYIETGSRVGVQHLVHPKQMRVDTDCVYLPLYMAHLM